MLSDSSRSSLPTLEGPSTSSQSHGDIPLFQESPSEKQSLIPILKARPSSQLRSASSTELGIPVNIIHETRSHNLSAQNHILESTTNTTDTENKLSSSSSKNNIGSGSCSYNTESGNIKSNTKSSSKYKLKNTQTQSSPESKGKLSSKASTSNSKVNTGNNIKHKNSANKHHKDKYNTVKHKSVTPPDIELPSLRSRTRRRRVSDTSKTRSNTTITPQIPESASTSRTLDSLVNLNNSEASSSHLNATYPTTSHKYPLRSQGKRRSREFRELGASSSQQVTREENESSRLARSGAVLRRSTRNKGM